ncbi:MAG: hypothetical protein R3Y64_00135 [Peptostreptococcaceae bacterium]
MPKETEVSFQPIMSNCSVVNVSEMVKKDNNIDKLTEENPTRKEIKEQKQNK